MKYVPVLDKEFRPMYETFRNYLKEVNASEHKTLKVCVERNDGYNYVYEYPVYSSADKATENNKMAERIIKTILWVVGGYKIYIAGDDAIFEYIKKAYSKDGIRNADSPGSNTKLPLIKIS